MKSIQDVGALKHKCVHEFKKYLLFLNKGYQKPYSHILNLISLINTYKVIDNRNLITSYLLNYEPY